MDSASVCDCPFLDRCPSFADRLVEDLRKGPTGMGCRGQSDAYRNEHCNSFRCQFLCAIFSDMLSGAKPARG